MSAAEALKRYLERQAKQSTPKRRRRNHSPEADVKRAVMVWLKDNGWSMNAVEAKAVWNPGAGRYLRGQTTPGVSDLIGCAPDGTGAFIELKSPGRRGTLKPHQRQYLFEKIQRGSFAVCVDSVECLVKAWTEFTHRRKMDLQLGKAFLLRHLPTVEDEKPEQDFLK